MKAEEKMTENEVLNKKIIYHKNENGKMIRMEVSVREVLLDAGRLALLFIISLMIFGAVFLSDSSNEIVYLLVTLAITITIGVNYLNAISKAGDYIPNGHHLIIFIVKLYFWAIGIIIIYLAIYFLMPTINFSSMDAVVLLLLMIYFKLK